jgi:hypothetical protein
MILYTFRTNKNIADFLNLAGLSLDTPVFVIDKPSQDIPKLLNLISDQESKWVIGFASIARGSSRWENFAVNRFGSGMVSHDLPLGAELKLSKPDFLGELSKVPVGEGMSASFCNQAAFRVEEFIKLSNPKIRSAFLHFRSN